MLLYFVPTDSNSVPNIDTVGLSHIAERTDLMQRQVLNGPTGRPGFVFANRRSIPEPQLGYFVATQTWQDFGRFAIGRIKDQPVNPESLKRTNVIEGHTWTDWTGSRWTIPVARRWVDGAGNSAQQCALTRHLTINEAGEWVYSDVLPHLKQLWELACEFEANRLVAHEHATGGQISVELPALDLVCSVVFGCNYRVTKYELSFLKTLTPETSYQVLCLVVDDPGFDALLKKTLDDGGTTLSGVE